MEKVFYAHSDPSGKKPSAEGAAWQILREHLINVSRNAEKFARSANPENNTFIQSARWAGLLHDMGKYSDAFQQRILGALKRVEHSGHGAAKAQKHFAVDTALAIAGHHAGLPAIGGSTSSLKERVNRCNAEADILWNRMCDDFANCGHESLLNGNPLATLRIPGNKLDLYTRMLESVLVDADRLDAAGSNCEEHPFQDASLRLQRLQAYIEERAAKMAPGPLREARRMVLEACLAASEKPQRLQSLTVPTGGGKTLASMAFAIRRAALTPQWCRRIIVVIPYLSIIEQNASVFAQAIGEDIIFEHHSGNLFEEHDSEEMLDTYQMQKRLAAENWNVPIVVTTSVRFFESLFSNRPADLRRLHNIARSVVILDEVQVLPRNMLRALLSMIRELSDEWGTTFLFCTATQPAFERPASAPNTDQRWEPGTITEIIENPKALFSCLSRVRIQWPGSDENSATISWKDLAARVSEEKRSLCIVNLRDHAMELFKELIQAPGIESDSIWHLSTRMCAQHRLDVLEAIRQRLMDKNAACRVVSTQLVEAGVDIDFPALFRAMGPFDSIAQACGRCDREGLCTAAAGEPAGQVFVFEPEIAEGKQGTPPGAYTDATAITRIMALSSKLSINDPVHIREFFNRWYESDLDSRDIEPLRNRLDFPEVAARFSIIDDISRAVLVPYDKRAQQLIEIAAKSKGIPERKIYCRLQRYQVGLREHEFRKAIEIGAVSELVDKTDIWVCDGRFYSNIFGFVLESNSPLII